jgi:hypothetical protein
MKSIGMMIVLIAVIFNMASVSVGTAQVAQSQASSRIMLADAR